MTRIGIDARFVVSELRGMGRVTRGFLDHLAQIDQENEYVMYVASPDIDGMLPSRPNFKTRVLSPSFYPAYEQVCLPLAAHQDDLDVLHCPANTGPIILPNDTKLVLTLHDVIFHKPYSEIPRSSNPYQAIGRLYRRVCTRLLRTRVDYCITVSETSKADITKYLGLAAPVEVIYPGIDEAFFEETIVSFETIQEEYGLDKPYIFHLGGTAPSKNSLATVRAFESYLDRTDDRELTLAIRGVPPSGNEIVDYVKSAGLDERVNLLPFLSDQELRCVYAGAKLFVLSSLYEGFGLTPVEAMASGTAVLASNRGSVPEVVDDAGVLVNPIDKTELSKKLESLIADDLRREELVARGRERARQFHWESAAKRLLTVYYTVAKGV